MGKIILITGGARSGKSRIAEQYIYRLNTSVAYIATSQIYDEEMAYRVKLHQQRRPTEWQTFEAPFNADKAITTAFVSHQAILFDCLTLYLSNHLCLPESDNLSMDELTTLIKNQFSRLITAVQEAPADKTCIFVTNEVGAGIVPENKLSRNYRDLAGIGNQLMAAAADEVYLVVSGLSLQLK